jgi:CheY-like chemotaxis protein/HPt (histidine-containing phosphotransfer) domain-containing protein
MTPEAEHMTASSENPQLAGRKAPHVLVAEDSPLNQQVALKQLEKLGCTSEAVTDGSQVLEALRRTHFDIILMDCQMPEMSGYEAAWQIREQEKKSAGEASPPPLYIIAMTANTEADNRMKCLEAGMDDFINKPVQLPELEAALHRALADRAAQRALDEVIDPVIIAGLRQLRMPGKPDALVELIDLFLKEAPDRLNAIEKAIARNDVTSLAVTRNSAAALKGSAGNLGARNLAALCDEIEQSSKTGLLSDAAPLVDKAREEFGRVRDALIKIKSETPEGN